MKRSVQLVIVSTCLATTLVAAQTSTKPLQGSFQAGAGYWMGDATYSIGGEAWSPEEGSIRFQDKISELKFPLDVAYGAIAGNLLWKGRIEFFGSIMANLSDPSSKMKDSDWGVFEDSEGESLDIYSESDAELSAFAMDVGARLWFHPTPSTNRFACAISMGPSLMYQNLDWTISNVEQAYPSRPEYGTDTSDGLVATYNAQISMLYFNACALLKFKQVSSRLEFGAGPAIVQDEDDHILREKRSTAELGGFGIKATAELRYNLTQQLFALAHISVLAIEATGTSTQKGYGSDMTGYYAEIDEDFSLTSAHGGIALGYSY